MARAVRECVAGCLGATSREALRRRIPRSSGGLDGRDLVHELLALVADEREELLAVDETRVQQRAHVAIRIAVGARELRVRGAVEARLENVTQQIAERVEKLFLIHRLVLPCVATVSPWLAAHVHFPRRYLARQKSGANGRFGRAAIRLTSLLQPVFVEARDELRAQIERWRRSEAEEILAHARGEPHAVFFPRRDVVELLHEARNDLEPLELEASAAHLARAVAERSLAGARAELEEALSARHFFGRQQRTWRALLAGVWQGAPSAQGRALVEVSARAAESADRAWRTARRQSDRAAGRFLAELGIGVHADAGPDTAARHALAERWLDATDDALRGALEERGVHELSVLAERLRATELDARVDARTRWRRFGARLEPLGHDRALDRVLRVAAPHRAPWPAPRLATRRSGRELFLLPPRLDHGVLGEVLAAEVVGRGVALAFVSPGLPPALARPAVSTVARAHGALFVQQLAEGAAWRRQGLEEADAERVARQVAFVWLLVTRVAAVGALLRGLHDAPKPSGLLLADTAPAPTLDVDERVTELVERALGVAVPTTLARSLAWNAAGSGARLRAYVGACALWAALRDRHDEDWYRNPRADETLRAAFERGGGLGVEGWHDELGVGVDDALGRARELFARI